MKRNSKLKRTRPPGRKRKVLTTMGLSLILLFGRARFNSSKSLNPNFDNNSRHVILAKAGSSSNNSPVNFGPSNFPTPSSGGRPSWPVYVPKTRIAPRVMDPGAGANPAGAGGGGAAAEFDDNSTVPNKKPLEESKTREYHKKQKKQSAEQCELDENAKKGRIEIVSKIKESPALVREARKMGKDQAAQRDVNHLIEQLASGNKNPGIGNERVKGLKNVSEARGRNEGRVYFREKNGKIEILGKSNKDNQKKVISI
jgi:hypothetical protein